MIICDEVNIVKYYEFNVGKDKYKSSSAFIEFYIKYKDKNKLGLRMQKQRLKELQDTYMFFGQNKYSKYNIIKIGDNVK